MIKKSRTAPGLSKLFLASALTFIGGEAPLLAQAPQAQNGANDQKKDETQKPPGKTVPRIFTPDADLEFKIFNYGICI